MTRTVPFNEEKVSGIKPDYSEEIPCCSLENNNEYIEVKFKTTCKLKEPKSVTVILNHLAKGGQVIANHYLNKKKCFVHRKIPLGFFRLDFFDIKEDFLKDIKDEKEHSYKIKLSKKSAGQYKIAHIVLKVLYIAEKEEYIELLVSVYLELKSRYIFIK